MFLAAVGKGSLLGTTAPSKAARIFDYRGPVLFADDFHSGRLDRWTLNENAHYGLPHADPDRIAIVDAPGCPGMRAVRLRVPRRLDSFRSELALPFEPGFHERWYSERIYVPADWVIDRNAGNDIVMQWHAIPGNWRATFPNLALSIGNDGWYIQRSSGAAQTGPIRSSTRLDEPLRPGAWVSWRVHAKWRPGADGLLEFWRDGKRVAVFHGINVYTTIGVAYTPYLQTGIYHPAWHNNQPGRAAAFAKELPGVTQKVVWIADVKVADERGFSQ